MGCAASKVNEETALQHDEKLLQAIVPSLRMLLLDHHMADMDSQFKIKNNFLSLLRRLSPPSAPSPLSSVCSAWREPRLYMNGNMTTLIELAEHASYPWTIQAGAQKNGRGIRFLHHFHPSMCLL